MFSAQRCFMFLTKQEFTEHFVINYKSEQTWQETFIRYLCVAVASNVSAYGLKQFPYSKSHIEFSIFPRKPFPLNSLHCICIIELFQLIQSKVNTRLLQVCFATLCDCLIKLTQLCQPIKSKTKSNLVLLEHFPTLGSASNYDWLVVSYSSVVIGHTEQCTLVFALRHSIENRSINWKRSIQYPKDFI